jgi:Ion channel
MDYLLALLALVLIVLCLVDGFEDMILPRRVARPFRPTRVFYRTAWPLWRWLAGWLPKGRRREGFLSVFGPLSLLALFAIWVVGLILGFALLNWSLGSGIKTDEEKPSFFTYAYLSGVTFFTVGYGEVTPRGPLGRFLAVVEAGGGFWFLAMVIGYLPVLYQAFSRREVTISLLDARAGSPPSAGQLLLRAARGSDVSALASFLTEWERWSAELLESHLSFPFLSLYRSQHDNQSWLAALTFMLDTSALIVAGAKGSLEHQAQLTFAMARHAAVDFALMYRTPPRLPTSDRFPNEQWHRLRQLLAEAGFPLREGPLVDAKIAELRTLYEPFVNALADNFVFRLPPFWAESATVDNWQTSAWTGRTPGINKLLPADADNYTAD